MLFTVFALAAVASAAAFAPIGPHPMGLAHSVQRAVSTRGIMMQAGPSSIQKEITLKDITLTADLFKQLDVDSSGSISVDELKAIFGNTAEADIGALMKRADLNHDGKLGYAEYERLMNMQNFGDAQGGNLYVRNAINLGLLKSDSILADGKASIFVGNKGFDPLSLATNYATIKGYREAELKHGRLAMLAAAGWPVSELAQPYLSKLLGAPDLLVNGEQAPSILNGGLDKINPLFFMAIVAFSAIVEATALKMDTTGDYIPGDLGFDPFSLYTGKNEAVKRDLELKELNNGRLAMLAITYYAYEEFVNKGSVVMLNPALFKNIL